MFETMHEAEFSGTPPHGLSKGHIVKSNLYNRLYFYPIYTTTQTSYFRLLIADHY